MDLIEYVRDDKDRPIGCVAAVDRDNIGWSICHTKDRFDKKMGKKIALDRARKEVFYKKYVEPIDCDFDTAIDYWLKKINKPSKYKTRFMLKAINKMKGRAEKYYK